MMIPKSILIAVASVAAALLLLGLLVRLLENALTFHPMRELELTPDDYGLDYEELTVASGEPGHRLHGWYFPPGSDTAPVLLVCHGNAGNISHRLEWVAPFVNRGWGVALFDYRGYGRSEGKPTEQGLYEDTRAVYDWLRREQKVGPERIVPFGRSLGGAPASWLAASQPVGRLVLEGTFTNGRDIGKRLFGYVPLYLAAKYRWPVNTYLARVEEPVLIIHGTADTVVPFALGRKLAESAAGRPNVHFVPVTGGDHLNLHHVLGNEYYRYIGDFIRSGDSPVD